MTSIDDSTVRILQDYRDKCYVSNILCVMNCEYYKTIRQLINIPLILSSTIMSIMNSSTVPENDLKIANIVLNASTSLLLSLIGNFKIVEKTSAFRNSAHKFNKLCHLIEDKLMIGENITNETVRQIIIDYDNINESLEFSFTNRSKDKCKKRFGGKRTLPNILNCEIDFNDPNADRRKYTIKEIRQSPKDLFSEEKPGVFVDNNKVLASDISIQIDKTSSGSYV